MKHAVVLLSGGIDSATTLAIALSQSYECSALSFDYGQRHRFELQAAERIANSLGASEHCIVKIDNRAFAELRVFCAFIRLWPASPLRIASRGANRQFVRRK